MKTLPVRRSKDTGHAAEHAAEHAVDRPTTGASGSISELERLRRQISPWLDAWWPFGDLDDAFRPLADIEELDDAYVVEIELPGVRREDVAVELTGRELTVTGERREKERVGILRRRERTTGQFRYEVVLPGDVDDDHVEAGFDEGVLQLRLPKPEHDRPRKIRVG